MCGLDCKRRPGSSGERRRQLEGIDFLRFQKPGIRLKGCGRVDIRRGVNGPGDDGVETESVSLDLLGKDLGAYRERTCTKQIHLEKASVPVEAAMCVRETILAPVSRLGRSGG